MGRLGVRFFHHLNDADHALFCAGMVEEAEIAFAHRAHSVARLVVAHAPPLGTLAAFFFLLIPGPGVSLRFEQPIGHGIERRKAHSSSSALLMVHSHGRISQFANRPALANGSPAGILRAASSDEASTTTRLPFMVSPSGSVKGPASTSVSPRLSR